MLHSTSRKQRTDIHLQALVAAGALLNATASNVSSSLRASERERLVRVLFNVERARRI